MSFDIAKKKIKGNEAWFNYEGGKFLVRSASSPEFLDVKDRVERPYRKKIDRNKLSSKVSNQLMRETVCKGLVMDWKDIVDGGEPVKFSEEALMQILENDDDFALQISEFAGDQENYRVALKDKAKK